MNFLSYLSPKIDSLSRIFNKYSLDYTEVVSILVVIAAIPQTVFYFIKVAYMISYNIASSKNVILCNLGTHIG